MPIARGSVADVALELRSLSADTSADFERIVRDAGADAAQCLCTAAYVRFWEDPSLARPCRDRILAEGRSDGFLLHEDGAAIGWCQAAARDTMPYYRDRSRAVDARPGVFAVTCLLLLPAVRRRGLSRELLRMVLDELRRGGARAIHAFPCRYGEDEDTSESIEFPERLCQRAGMALLQDHRIRPLYGLVAGG